MVHGAELDNDNIMNSPRKIRIIQSLWTKPLYKKRNINLDDRPNGGWSDSRYYWFSSTLSCLKLLEFYEEVELYTDPLGKHLLIDILQLPYSKVHVVLEAIDHFPIDLWALGKIYSYSLQDSPFIHVDNDVFIWERFPIEIESAQLLAQNLDDDLDFYKYIIQEVKEVLLFDEFLKERLNGETFYSLNAGIIGGNNYHFFKNYADYAFEFINKNLEKLSSITVAKLNVIIEQFFIFSLAQKQNIPIQYLFGNLTSYEPLSKFHGIPNRSTYVHLIGTNRKKNPINEIQVETILRYEYPAHYEHLLNTLRSFKTPLL